MNKDIKINIGINANGFPFFIINASNHKILILKLYHSEQIR